MHPPERRHDDTMKRIFAFLLIFALLLPLAACGEDEKARPSSQASPSSSLEARSPSSEPQPGPGPEETSSQPDASQPDGEDAPLTGDALVREIIKTYGAEETTGQDGVTKLVPKTRESATILYRLYILLTVLCVGFLLLGGMPLFDSLCTAMGTAGTGGFGIKNDSMAGYSPYLQNVCTVFMALFGVNFSLYYLLLLGRVREALFNEELRLYVGIILASVAAITFNILPLYGGQIRGALHDAAFTVSSIITTTGFATADFNLWPQLSRTILVVLMVVGACAGSTGGGIKCARVILLTKSLKAHIRQSLHPRSVNLIQVEGRTVEEETIQGVNTYMSAYCAIAVVSVLILALDNCSIETNLTAMLACLNNIGPGLDLVGPTSNYFHFSDLSKIVLMLDMLLGRLEIFPLLVMLSPRTWKKA